MPDDVTGARKGDYLILGTLGAGGMGKVYKVRNTLSDRVEAMKVLLPDLSVLFNCYKLSIKLGYLKISLIR